VDTNVLVYAHDRGTGRKHERARDLIGDLWESRSGILSIQVLQELYVNLSRKLARKLPRPEVRQIVADYLRWPVVANSSGLLLGALQVEERFGLSFWDALIVQAAEAGGAETLYSEDLNHGQAYGSVKVINPFKS
jgi:predicted nucleic acid-binding protein